MVARYTEAWDSMTQSVSTTHIQAQYDEDPRIYLIPNDPTNRDWIAFQAWLDEGNTLSPYEPGA